VQLAADPITPEPFRNPMITNDRAYHSTRLLDGEAAAIRRQGLLENLFVRRLLHLPETYGDVHHPVRPEDITDIWQPGHCDYDRHPLLPRS
jgi:hypothetical protein